MKKTLMMLSLIGVACTSYVQNANAQPWDINGNASTNQAVNFLGTTDAMGLRFRVNNIPAGALDDISSGGSTNCTFGVYANLGNAGADNTAVGTFALAFNVSGGNNVAVGTNCMWFNNSGRANNGLGFDALAQNTKGSSNNAIGYQALNTNDADDNNAMGTESLYSNYSGTSNTAIGTQSLYYNTSQNYNVAVGREALKYNGSVSTVEDQGSNNVAVGYQSLFSNNTGYWNTAVGSVAMQSNTTGFQNVACGHEAMRYNSTGWYNTAFGDAALAFTSTGSQNTSIGLLALGFNNTGTSNTALGVQADVSNVALTNATALGAQASVDVSNKVRVGNTFVTSIGGQVGWTTFSDARYKKNIQENVPGLDFINKLKPVTYVLDIDGVNKHYDKVREKNMPADKKDEWEKLKGNIKQEGNPAASTTVHTGFLAQDVEKAAKELNYDFDGVDKPANEDVLYGLRYGVFVVPLVKAVQEQQTMITDLNKQNDMLAKQNMDLNTRLEKLEKLVAAQSGQKTDLPTGGMQLDQNVPNPFSANTMISYSISESGTVLLQLFNIKGEKVKVLENLPKDKGQYNYTLDGTDLQPGTYYYTLTLNGKELVRNAIKL